MITISKTAKAIQRFFEATAKARVNSALLGMGREKVEELGYSYEALRAGPSAWPWRKTTQDSAKEREIQTNIRELQDYTDGQLNKNGISRDRIEQVRRDGRPGIDCGQDAA